MADVRFRSIVALQEPFDLGVDDLRRYRYVFNILAVKEYSQTFIEELTTLLELAGVGTHNVNIFATARVVIPSGAGPYTGLRETGGTAPEETQNSLVVPAYVKPSAQVLVTGERYAEVRTMLSGAYLALTRVRNRSVTV